MTRHKTSWCTFNCGGLWLADRFRQLFLSSSWSFARCHSISWVLSSLWQALKSKHAGHHIPGAGPGEGQRHCQLDVDVAGLIFSHHPLFSREHVLGARLAQLYDQHLARQNRNLTGLLTDKVPIAARSSLPSHLCGFTWCSRLLTRENV